MIDVTIVHKGCGGRVYEDYADPFRYEYPQGDDTIEMCPRIKCGRCGDEITDDAMLEFVGRDARLFNVSNREAEPAR